MDQSTNLKDKLGLFEDYWAPRTIAKFNGHAIMVVKVKGEFVWHKHDETDDFFLVLKGRLTRKLGTFRNQGAVSEWLAGCRVSSQHDAIHAAIADRQLPPPASPCSFPQIPAGSGTVCRYRG